MATSAPLPSEQTAQPSAVRTFLIADVRGYTRFTQEHGDEAAARLASLFAEVVRDGVRQWEGEVIELRGDEALVAFVSARQALRSAFDLQSRFAREAEERTLPLYVGIGLDSGEAVSVEGGYRGGALNLAARLCSLAAPGEVLASEGVAHLARKTEGLAYSERGLVDLKGFADQVRVIEVRAEQSETQAVGERSSPVSETVPEQTLPIGGFLGALPAERLVAREEELSTILTEIDAVESGSGRLILLSGEPGVGKTRLAQEVTLQVRNRRFIVASGRCYEPRQTVAFYPFLDVLSTLYVCSPESIRSAAKKQWNYMGRLLPDFDITAPAAPSNEAEEQERLFRAVTGFVQAVSELAPVAILLDDLHWADAGSLELVQHLARHTRGDRVLMLGTYRDIEVGRQHPLEAALRDLNRERLVSDLPIRRLTREGTGALTAATFGEEQVSTEFAELLQRHTEGNPFFLEEVLRALVERGDIYRENDRWERREIGEIEVPKSVRSALGERLSRLDETAQEVLYEASVLGQTFAFEDLEQMGGRSEKDLEQALEQAVAGGLIRESGKDDFSFNHALTQQALYDELPARRRRRLHLAAGLALQEQPAKIRERRAAELAWHFLEADDPPTALKYALMAGDQSAAVFAHEEAERHYRTAVELARESDDGERQAEALQGLGKTLLTKGRFEEALGVFDAAAKEFRKSGDLAREGSVIAFIGRAHALGGTGQQAIPMLENAAKDLEATGNKKALAEVLVALAHLYFVSGRYEEMKETSLRAAAVAREIGDQEIMVEAEVRHSTALQKLGRLEEGIAVGEAIMPKLETWGRSRVVGSHLNNMGFAHFIEGNFAKSLAFRKRALDHAYTVGDVNGMAFGHAMMSQELIAVGEWDEARAHVEKARRIEESLPSSWCTPYVKAWSGWISFARGDRQAARHEYDEILRVAESSGDNQALGMGLALTAELELEDGNAETVVARLQPAMPRFEPEEELWLVASLALAYVRVGRLEIAEKVIRESEELLRKIRNRWNLVDVLTVHGVLRREQGRYSEAVEALSEAISMGQDMPYPYAEGKALFELGLTDIANGNDAGARSHLEQALEIFETLGARSYLEKTQGALSRLAGAGGSP